MMQNLLIELPNKEKTKTCTNQIYNCNVIFPFSEF